MFILANRVNFSGPVKSIQNYPSKDNRMQGQARITTAGEVDKFPSIGAFVQSATKNACLSPNFMVM